MGMGFIVKELNTLLANHIESEGKQWSKMMTLTPKGKDHHMSILTTTTTTTKLNQILLI